MSDRRFTDKPDLAPWAVRGLSASHPAMVESRTLFPSTVVEVTKTAPDRLLVSGENNRKLGKTVTKGSLKGYALFGLSLEERATCPDDCAVRDVCYGNGMQLARRHRIGEPLVFFARLSREIGELTDQHEGVLIRLHVLGDFPSVEYVRFWRDALAANEKVAVYGYTGRRTTAWGGDEIGDAIEAAKDEFPDRFRIRWSSEVSRPDGAVVVSEVPQTARTDHGVVCPAQTDATACCATCGLCWEPAAKRDCIVFIRHGPKSGAAHAESAMEAARLGRKAMGKRPIKAIQTPGVVPNEVSTVTPVFDFVDPASLFVDEAYQRGLSERSISLIRRIVGGWDWAKFKPPVCARADDGLEVIDGQHTAIAAAAHPGITTIPVIIVDAATVEARAAAFVGHNRDRIGLTATQIFYGSLAAGDPDALTVSQVCQRAKVRILRLPPSGGHFKPGDTMAVAAIGSLVSRRGAMGARKVLQVLSDANCAPIRAETLKAVETLFYDPEYSDQVDGDAITTALIALGSDLDREARVFAATHGVRIWKALAITLFKRSRRGRRRAA